MNCYSLLVLYAVEFFVQATARGTPDFSGLVVQSELS